MSNFPETGYRSPGLLHGYFRRLGNLHLHVDGGGEPGLIMKILKELESDNTMVKLNVISNALAGPQRQILPEVYASHTPRAGSLEKFEYFSTIQVETRDRAIGTLRRALQLIGQRSGIVIELEHVVARIENGRWSSIDHDQMVPIESDELGFDLAATLPFEIHHAVQIMRDHPPLTLAQLHKESIELGLRVGGWFEFIKDKAWAYRSNAFAAAAEVEGHARTSHQVLDKYLKRRGWDYELWTMVEHLIAVLRTPVQRIPKTSVCKLIN